MKLPRKQPPSGRTEMLDIRKGNTSEILLDHAPVSYLVLDSSGVILDANLEAARLLGKESRFLKGTPLSDFIYEGDRGKFNDYIDHCQCNGERAAIQLQLAFPGTPIVELVSSVSPPSQTGKVVLQTVIHLHATNGTRLAGGSGRDREVQKLSRTLKALSKSSQAMMRAQDQATYMNEVCKIVQEDCGHAMIWIGLAHNDAQKSIEPVAWAGFEEGYLGTLKLTWADAERGRGPTGTAVRTAQAVMCRNMHTDPRFKPWRKEAIRRGYASSIALPLIGGGKAFGAVTIYSRENDPFSDDEVNLLSQLADDLAYGLMAVRLKVAHEAAEQSLRESEERHRALFESMTEGFALHEIITDSHGSPRDYRFLEVNPSFERLTGLKRADLLGKRVLEVLPGTESVWIENYGRVALTGEPAHFESFSASLNRWYEVFAYRPAPLQFAAIFTDISSRKRAEEERREVEERVRRKLESVLMPEGDLGVLELGDLIDVPAMQTLMNDFYAVSRFPMSIADMKGKVLVGVGWQDICTRFHRVHPESCRQCLESDTQLSAGVPPGDFRQYKCKNNLWDIATPIVVGGRQIGNIFSGQFFYEDEQVDRELFRDQARRYGFDEAQYLAALDRVPRLNRETVDRGMAFLLNLAGMLSHLGYSNAKLARLLGERDRLTASLHEEQERLQRSEDKYSALFNTTSDGVWIHNLDGEIIEVNDAYCRMSGYSREELLRMRVQGLEAAEDPGEIATHIQDVLQKGGHDRFESRHRRKDGSSFDVDITALYLERDGGRVAIFVRDITERKRAEAALQESRNKYQALIETTSDFIWEMDAQGRYSYCSPQSERLWGLKTTDMIGKTPFDLMPPDQRQQGLNAFLEMAKSPRPFSGLESAALDGRGNLIFIETSGVPFFDRNGVLLGYRGITRDITERKKVDVALRTSQREIQEILESISDGFWAVDGQWRFVYINGRAAENLGYEPPDLIGKNLWETFPSMEGSLHALHYRKVMNERAPSHFGIDGVLTSRDYALSVYPSGDGISVYWQDITERRQAEKQLQRSTERFALLSETAGALLGSPDPQSVIEELCRKVMAHLDCDIFFNFLVDENAQCLRLNACGGVAPEDLDKVQWLNYGVAVCGRVARDKRRAIVEDIQHIPDERTALVRSFGVQAYCCHPLMVGDRVLGTLSFGSRQRPQFSDDEVELMRVVADQVSVALERIRTEQAQRESEERLQEALRVSRSFAFEWVPATDRMNRSLSCSTLLGLTGKDAEEDTGEKFFQRLDPADRERFVRTVSGLTPEVDRYETKYRLTRPDGGTTIVEESGRGTFDSEGKLTRVIGITTDVTAREQAEEALRELNAKLEQRVQERTAALKKTTEALNAERQRFMDVLDLLPAYVILLSPDHRVPFANRFFEERFGKSHGRRCYEYLFNRTEPCEVCETFRALKENRPITWEWTGPDGRIYDISDFPHTDTDGSKLILEMGIDITDRKRAEAELEKHRHHLEDLVKERTSQLSAANVLLQSEIVERIEAEQALQESEERFRLAIQHSRLMAWQCDTTMRFTWVYNSHFGVPGDQFLGKTPADLGYEAGMQEFIAHGREVLAQGRGTRKIIKHVHVDDREEYFDQQIEAVRDSGGNIIGLIGISLDVTERFLAEQRLHRSEESFRLMVAHSVEPMLLVDESGRIECVSRKAAEQLGYHDTQLLGTNIERFLDWSGKLDLTMRLEDFLRHAPLPARAVLRVKTSAGTWCWIDLEASFVNYGQDPQKYLLKFELINTNAPR